MIWLLDVFTSDYNNIIFEKSVEANSTKSCIIYNSIQEPNCKFALLYLFDSPSSTLFCPVYSIYLDNPTLTPHNINISIPFAHFLLDLTEQAPPNLSLTRPYYPTLHLFTYLRKHLWAPVYALPLHSLHIHPCHPMLVVSPYQYPMLREVHETIRLVFPIGPSPHVLKEKLIGADFRPPGRY
jgi:hypothetical protein